MGRRLATALLMLGALSCTSPRTQIVAQFDTDMTQGRSGTLTAIRVRVYSHQESEPRFDQHFELGVGAEPILLPAQLGLVPRDDSDRRVTVEADALSAESLLFTRRAVATFASQRTLLLELFLPDRCRFPENRVCPEGFTCGISGCEAIEREMLPDFVPDAGATDAAGSDAGPATDAGPTTDACPNVCADACVDVSVDPAHCGTCNNACIDAPPDATPACREGSCEFDCSPGFHVCAGACAADGDPTACGSACVSCPSPPSNGSASCVSGACELECNAGFVPSGAECRPVGAPRALAPLSMSRTGHDRPTFRWELPAGADGARVELCSDPACATVVTTLTGTGTSVTPPTSLPTLPVAYYWRLSAMQGAVTSSETSPVWAFLLPYRLTGTAPTSWPQLLDVELDGHGEIAVGAPDSDSVHVYRGSATGPVVEAPLVLTGATGSRLGASLARIGDVDGDGTGDLLVGAPGARQAHVFRGSPAGLSTSATILSGGASFGASVAAAGDVDGDGYADVVVGAPDGASVFLFRGSVSGIVMTPAATLTGPAGSRFGAGLAAGGDVNGDGFSDVVVGAPDADLVHVYLGGAGGLVTGSPITLSGTAGSRFGASISVLGDVNADGLCDVVVGAPGVGMVTIYNGSAEGPSATPTYTLTETASEFGIAVALVSDTDQNGHDDVFVGTATNEMYEYLSNASGPGARPGWNLVVSAPAGATGFSLAIGAAGVEHPGDRFADLVIGAPQSGTAYFYTGSGPGITGAPTRVFAGPPASLFGQSVN